MRIKAGVDILGTKPELIIGYMITVFAYHDAGEKFVLTGGREGKHTLTSLHNSGNAFDCRLPKKDAQGLRDEIKRRTGIDFDVVLERDHIHVEYQPRTRG